MPGNRDFECIICHSVVRDCRTTACCGALFCGPCVEDNDLSDCPNCRKSDVSFVRNPAIQRLANDLDIQCEQCQHSYKQSVNHDSWCPEGMATCHFAFLGCDWEGRRKTIESHYQEHHSPQCPKGGHVMVKSVVNDDNDDNHYCECDICGQSIVKGLAFYFCKECDYHECVGCFSHRPVRSLARYCLQGNIPLKLMRIKWLQWPWNIIFISRYLRCPGIQDREESRSQCLIAMAFGWCYRSPPLSSRSRSSTISIASRER